METATPGDLERIVLQPESARHVAAAVKFARAKGMRGAPGSFRSFEHWKGNHDQSSA